MIRGGGARHIFRNLSENSSSHTGPKVVLLAPGPTLPGLVSQGASLLSKRAVAELATLISGQPPGRLTWRSPQGPGEGELTQPSVQPASGTLP